MQPLNYMLRNASPVEAINQGIAEQIAQQASRQDIGLRADANTRANAQDAREAELQPLRIQQAESQLESAALNREVTRERVMVARERRARQEAFRSRLGTLGPDATADEYAALNQEFPEFGASIRESMGMMDESRQRGILTRVGKVATAIKAGDPELAERLATEYADAAENSGDPQQAAVARSIAELIRIDPQAALAPLGMMLADSSKDIADQIFGTGGRGVQSSQIIGGRVSVQTMRDGSSRVIDTATNEVLTGDEAREAIAAAEDAEAMASGAKAGERTRQSNIADVETAGQAKAAESMGALQTKFLENAQKSVTSINSSIRNIDRAIEAIDSGARAGFIARRLPDITQASAELTNAMNNMGLDVIGSVTFGALSEGELRLAMDVAVPRGLNGDRLRNWLVERRDAQEKVRAAIAEQQQFLSNPNNTLQDWYERVYSSGEATPQATPSQYGLPEDTSPEDFARYDAIVQKRIADPNYVLTPSEKAFVSGFR